MRRRLGADPAAETPARGGVGRRALLPLGALDQRALEVTPQMPGVGYKDFPLRKVSPRLVGVGAVPESKQAFLGRIDQFLAQRKRRLVSIETHEGFFRVWYQEE